MSSHIDVPHACLQHTEMQAMQRAYTESKSKPVRDLPEPLSWLCCSAYTCLLPNLTGLLTSK